MSDPKQGKGGYPPLAGNTRSNPPPPPHPPPPPPTKDTCDASNSKKRYASGPLQRTGRLILKRANCNFSYETSNN
ncbi:uncharacterized protein LOC134231217 [Saccostrea cucullata]|uniref:uncharacterized protein LOC134231217 n=1 Tax=Saccostrea cuccullata TaxID=36930 RepID=UPI002ED1FFA4